MLIEEAMPPSGPCAPITVVTGLPRSGTSLMMQMLGAAGVSILSDSERVADEDNPRGYFEYAPVMSLRRDVSWLGEARGRALKIVAPLLTALPGEYEYRVIWMSRDLDEVLASQQRMLDHSGRSESGSDPAALRRAFESQLDRIRAELEQRAISILDVEYARAVAEPVAVAREVCDFLGGALDPTAAASAVDPALYRERTS